MMNALSMSAKIRAMKKKMEDDKEAVKLSGIPEDAQDIYINKQNEIGENLSENKPMERDEDPSLASLIAADSKAPEHEEMAPDPMEENEIASRHMKMRKMMARMGK